MKNFVLPVVLAFGILNAAAQATCDTIYWSPSLHLNWTDFKAPADSSSPFKAFTYSGIHFGWSSNGTQATVQTGATYYSCKSWVRDQIPVLLQHERLHFDITECYRRVLLQRVSHATFTKKNCADKLNSIYRTVNAEWQEAEAKYDLETNHGINHEKQASWEKYIRDKLQNLRAFDKNDTSLSLK